MHNKGACIISIYDHLKQILSPPCPISASSPTSHHRSSDITQDTRFMMAVRHTCAQMIHQQSKKASPDPTWQLCGLRTAGPRTVHTGWTGAQHPSPPRLCEAARPRAAELGSIARFGGSTLICYHLPRGPWLDSRLPRGPWLDS
eukprot:6918096-Prymnesium_polylepis.1